MAIKRKINGILKVVILLTLFLILAPQAAFAEPTFEVYTYGSGNFLATIFNGIAMITSGGMIHDLVKIGLVLALLYGLMTSLSSFIGASGMAKGAGGEIYKGEGFVSIVSIAMTAAVAVGLFLTPKATVALVDRVDPTQTQVVANVPLPSAFIPHVMSSIGDIVGKEFETVFSLPDAVQFRNGGVALGAKYTDALMNIYPPNSSTQDLPASAHLITKSLREYYIKCVFPNYATLDGNSGTKTALLDEMYTTPDLMTHLKSATFRDPNVVVLAPNDSGWASCYDAIDLIDAAWDANLPAWQKDIEMKLSGNAGLSSISGTGNPLNLGTGAMTTSILGRYFSNSSESPQQILKTLAAANLLRDSVDTYLAYMGSPTSTAMTAARRSTASGWLTAAKFFNTLVHTTRAIVEGLIYGLSVFLPLFFVFGGLSALVFYGKISLWLQMWVPIYVLINLYADQEVTRVIDNIFLTETAKCPTLKTMDLVADQLELTLGYVGSLAPVVPALAWGLVSGGAYAVTHAIQAVGGGSAPATAASQGAQIAGMGNTSMGNMSMGSTNLAGSTALSSQQQYRANVTQSMIANRSLDSLNDSFGGAGSYIDKAGQASAVTQTGNMATAAGQYDGAGRNMETLYDAKYGGGYGDMAGTINAAKARAEETGGYWQQELAGNVMASKMIDTAKTLGAENYMKEMGFNKAAEAVTLGELQRGHGALSMYNMGTMAGHDMNTSQGRADFYRGMTSAAGVNIGVTDGNVGAMNKQLKDMGVKTRLNAGDVANIKSADGLGITSVSANRGVDRAVNDIQRIETGSRAHSGSSFLRDDSSKALSGRSSIVDNSHRDLSGTSSVHDDSHKTLTGTSRVNDNSIHNISGYRGDHYNVDTRTTAGPGGYSVTQHDPKTSAVVAGAYKNLITSQTQTADGATTSTLSVRDGAVLTASSDLGTVRNMNFDRLNVRAGVDSDGMPSHTLRAGLENAPGMDKQKAEGALVAGETGLSIFGQVTSVIMRVGSTMKR